MVRTVTPPASQGETRAGDLMFLGPLFGLAGVLILLMAGSYVPVARRENLPFLSVSIVCVLLVGLSEMGYNHAGCS